ncbi:MAG: hypothetical protein A2046_08055 [Bacteroidetes bacterium GWA2_30_7]|nr:MAG: hypothetical protein A2046_08055 [Bacteroidetes bacterium GWA2_30_7]
METKNNSTNGNDYNQVYEKLVHDDKDFVGMLAYSIYKKQKQEFILKYRSEHMGNRPDTNELKRFHELASASTQLLMYRNQATELIQGITNFILREKKGDIDNYIKVQSKSKRSFMYGVFQSLLASLIWIVIISVVAVILWSLQHGPFETFKSIINHE